MRRSERNRDPVPIDHNANSSCVYDNVSWYKTRAGNDAFTVRSVRFPGTMFRYVSSQGNRHKNQATRRFVCVSCSKINNNRIAKRQKSISASGISVRDGQWLDDPDYPHWEHICIKGLHCVDRPRNTKRALTVEKPQVDAIIMMNSTHEGQTVLDELATVAGNVHELTSVSYRHLIRVMCSDLFARSNYEMPPVQDKRAYAQAFFEQIGAIFNPKDNKILQSMSMRCRRLLNTQPGEESYLKDSSVSIEGDEEQYYSESMLLDDVLDQDETLEDHMHFKDECFEGHPAKMAKTEKREDSMGSGHYEKEEINFIDSRDWNSVFNEPHNLPDDFFEAPRFDKDLHAQAITARFVELGFRDPKAPSFAEIWESVESKLLKIGEAQPFAGRGIQRFLLFKNVAQIEHLSPNDRAELALRLLPIALFGNDHAFFSKHLTKMFLDCHANMKTFDHLVDFYSQDSTIHPVMLKINGRFAVLAAKTMVTNEEDFVKALKSFVETYAVLDCEIPFEIYLPLRFLQFIYNVHRDKVSKEHKKIFEDILSIE
ncbi:hypothetical protein L596_028713 [Steinernema carpocapsae]|uniref:Uncharacterized protein n=1 Tax=Steinernema carpocapsae TaxID=34508 RepID=A0A4U5M081_STECR|nr:hypothetical protein L596_028713 [Steinernema carpocapsae]